LPWFVKENRRAGLRHRYDGSDTWIQVEGSLNRPCQVLDLSRTGVRLAVTNAHSLPNIFTLMLSKSSGGYRPARVKWRRGNEVGAEFITADSASVSQSTRDAPRSNSSSASRPTADAPRAETPCGAESQKSEDLMSALSLHAQAREPHAFTLKADARGLGGGISGDKAKNEAHCQMADSSAQLDRTDQKKSAKKRMDLSRLQKKLGPKHIALIHALKDIDPESVHGQELASIIESLDETCD
jgi:hypothetical protein